MNFPRIENNVLKNFKLRVGREGLDLKHSKKVRKVSLIECLIEDASECELKAIHKLVKWVYNAKYGRKKTQIEVPPEDRTFSPEELTKFFSHVRLPYYKFLFKFLLSTGMRIGEALKLHRDNVDLENCVVYTYLEKKEHKVMVKKYFPISFVPDFKLFFEWFNPKDKLFTVSDGNVRRHFHDTLKLSGLDRYYAKSKHGRKLYFFSLHSFRRVFASHLEEIIVIINNIIALRTHTEFF